MKVTAETITDAQIREYEADELERLRGARSPRATKERRTAVDLATIALSDAVKWSLVRSGKIDAAVANDHNRRRSDARARLAEIWNARFGGEP